MHKICYTDTREVLFMTLYDFGILDERARVNLVYLEGVYLGKRKEEDATLVLYQLHGFYVEISYQKYRYHIRRIRAFASTFLLDPYLDDMAIENLVGF